MRFCSLALILAALSLPISPTVAASGKPANRSVALVFPIPFSNDKEELPSDPEVVSTVASMLGDSGKVDVMMFNPDLPAVSRALLEGKIRPENLTRFMDQASEMVIARALGSAYVVRVQGMVDGRNISISLEMLKVPSGGRWVASSGSQIGDGPPSLKDTNRKNAIATAASTAVSQIAIMALGGAAVPAPGTSPEYATMHKPPKVTETRPRDLKSEIDSCNRQIDEYVQKDDLPNAVHSLRFLINLDPANSANRLKLASTYAKLGMITEAIGECNRALLFNKDDVSIYNALAEYHLMNGSVEDAAAQCREIVRLDPNNADVRINLGDICWNEGKIEDATKAYEDAAKLNPRNPAPRERLYKLCAAKGNHSDALTHLLLAKQAARSTEPNDEERYALFGKVIQDQFNAIMGKLKAAGEDYARKRMTREDYYRECKDIDALADGLAGFASAMAPPDKYSQAHAHGTLATSLLVQSTGAMVSYLETDKKQYADDAGMLKSEARTELSAFLQALQAS